MSERVPLEISCPGLSENGFFDVCTIILYGTPLPIPLFLRRQSGPGARLV